MRRFPGSIKTRVAAGATLSLISPKLSQPRCNAEEPIVGPVELGYASLVLRQEADYALPRLRLTARNDQPMTDEGVVRGLAVIAEVLQRKEPFTILWDVRSCCLPSRQQLRIGTDWARTHKPELDTYLAGIGILQSSRIVRAVANLVLRTAAQLTQSQH